MGYPRDNLAPGEVVVIHRHPHWKSLLLPVLTFWIATALAGIAVGYVRASDFADSAVFWSTVMIGALWLVVTGWFLIRPLLSWRTTHFVVTDRRVIYRTGILTRSGIDIPIRRINTVEFRHGPIDRLLRTGTLVIESASDEPLAFHDIPQVAVVHAQLYQELLDEHDDEDDRFGRRWDQAHDYDARRESRR